MARNVFISFLGTNNYLETYYSIGDFKSSQPVRFIQEALIEHLCREWTSEDIHLLHQTFFRKELER